MQVVDIMGDAAGHFLGFGHHVKDARGRIDDRRAGYPNLRRDFADADLPAGHGGYPERRINEAVLPKRIGVGADVAVRVEGVHAIVFGDYKYDVVKALAWNRKTRLVQRLGIDLSVHRL